MEYPGIHHKAGMKSSGGGVGGGGGGELNSSSNNVNSNGDKTLRSMPGWILSQDATGTKSYGLYSQEG